MTLTKKSLQKWQESMHVVLSKSQEAAILEQFGTEPEPWVWSGQDISEQINKFLTYGYFQPPELEPVHDVDDSILPVDL